MSYNITIDRASKQAFLSKIGEDRKLVVLYESEDKAIYDLMCSAYVLDKYGPEYDTVVKGNDWNTLQRVTLEEYFKMHDGKGLEFILSYV